MKILSSDILLQEIPDEISLGFAISNCPYQCKFCHTPELQKDIGIYWRDIIDTEIRRYRRGITCVLFLGGDMQWEELHSAAKYVKDNYKLKTAVYLGSESCPLELVEVFDYIKVGPYIHSLGGLDNIKTNQKLYEIKNGMLKDITFRFWVKQNE